MPYTDSMVSSRSVRTLFTLYPNCTQTLSPPGLGINLANAVSDMLALSVGAASLYDTDYIDSQSIRGLIKKATKRPEKLTLEEMNTLINGLGARLFLSFIERQLDRNEAEAWDKGVSHALEVKRKLDNLFTLTEVLTDDPMEGQLIGQGSEKDE